MQAIKCTLELIWWELTLPLSSKVVVFRVVSEPGYCFLDLILGFGGQPDLAVTHTVKGNGERHNYSMLGS